ncbi:YkgJ family cysteine cluster protein [Sedimentisphaera salicampi]|uniref:YkgJ family cysteine cluster protein n=1 Tax=Sedimentisphaera salicampi TaxID=1941349 RepID=UPI000B9A19A3|nr:YkgJ family cysteine cluster protein [Sedimentisphaera salicampi]OXU15698.1 Flagellin N-methylase [Sedimentisphaera salicampi]
MSNYPWYAAGLHFECMQCRNCCSGPGEGYVWVSEEELAKIAEKLGKSFDEVKKFHSRKAQGGMSLLEDELTKDCEFLTKNGCSIYSVRPLQCRTWPFWDCNLESPETWNFAAKRCPGINRGRLYTFEEIESIRNNEGIAV